MISRSQGWARAMREGAYLLVLVVPNRCQRLVEELEDFFPNFLSPRSALPPPGNARAELRGTRAPPTRIEKRYPVSGCIVESTTADMMGPVSRRGAAAIVSRSARDGLAPVRRPVATWLSTLEKKGDVSAAAPRWPSLCGRGRRRGKLQMRASCTAMAEPSMAVLVRVQASSPAHSKADQCPHMH